MLFRKHLLKSVAESEGSDANEENNRTNVYKLVETILTEGGDENRIE